MKAHFLYFFCFFLLVACQKKEEVKSGSFVTISDRVGYQYDGTVFLLKSGKFENKLDSKKLGLKRVVLLNSSLLGYFTELNLVDKIVGLSSPEYVFDEGIVNAMASNKIANVGNEQKYDLEKIIALKPDAVFTNYIPTFENTYDILRKSNIEIIFLDEYLETKPLDKARYLLLFGELFGCQQKAKERYQLIEADYSNIRDLAKQAKNQPTVLCNEMYGSQWFLPGGESSVALFFRDANARYILNDNKDVNAVALSFEEVFAKAESAQYWVNIGSYQSKKMMLNINANYDKMKVFNQGKLYMMNNRERGMANDYFQSANVRPDLVLKDYVKVFHPELLSDQPLYYLKELK